MDIEARLKDLGIVLPPPPQPAGNYTAGTVVGNLVFSSACVPCKADKTFITGKVGTDLSIEEGYAAARLTGLNMLANIKALIGDLNRVKKVVKVLGMVHCGPDFAEHPKVIDGFSDLFAEVFGDAVGKGGRAAVGMDSLPAQIAVQVEMILEIA